MSATADLHVLGIIHSPVFQGPHNRTSIVAQILAAQGVRTTVVLPEEAEAAAERMRERGVETVLLPLHRMRNSTDPRVHARWLRTLGREVSAIVDVIREREVDVLATNTLPNLHGPLAARRAGIACTWEIIDTYPPPAVRAAYMPAVFALADTVMTTGVAVADAHPGVKRFGDRWFTFYPCVDVHRFAPDPDVRAKVRAELGLQPDEVVVGNLSAMTPMKGHGTFVDAAARLRREVPGTRFVVLSSTIAEHADYRAGVLERARTLGLEPGRDLIVHDPGRAVHEWLQALDVFWMTSEPNSEGIPTAIGEAKAVGLPVVSTDVGAVRECVTDAVSGHVVAPRDAAAIAAATVDILADPERRARMGVAAREEAVAQFASERGAEAHLAAFRAAVDHHARRRFRTVGTRAPGTSPRSGRGPRGATPAG